VEMQGDPEHGQAFSPACGTAPRRGCRGA
jgi:hypothetical protein